MSPKDRAWRFIVQAEGGDRITDDPRDAGGLTRWGFSQRAYPGEDIRALTEARAQFLFQRDYWDACVCDALPPSLAIALADSAFNQGQGTAVRLLQSSLKVKADGIVGPATIAAAQTVTGEHVNQFLARRLVRYANGPTIFRLGWNLRVLRLKDAIQSE